MFSMAAVLSPIFFGVVSAVIAHQKGRSEIGWFIIGFIFLAFGLLVIFLPSVVRARINKQCPKCAEIIKANAVLCKHCRSPLDVFYEAEVK